MVFIQDHDNTILLIKGKKFYKSKIIPKSAGPKCLSFKRFHCIDKLTATGIAYVAMYYYFVSHTKLPPSTSAPNLTKVSITAG